jgi:N-glycosylase/DNA lyase
MYDAVGNHFRKLWGKEAGWAHSVLFTADLRTFSERLVSKVEVKAKQEKEKEIQISVKSAVAIKRPIDEGNEKKQPDSKQEILLEVAETKERRRTSKRLKKQ